MISIQIRIFAPQDKVSELIQFTNYIVDNIRKEDGCLKCDVLQDTSNNQLLIIDELWDSKQAAQTHLESTNLAALSGAKSILTLDLQILSSSMEPENSLQQEFNSRFSKMA